MVRPLVTRSLAVSLASEIFDLHIDSSQSAVKELDSYGDRNFYVRGKIKEGTEREFVLKVFNPEDFAMEGLIDEQHAAMMLLHKNGIPCSVPQATLTGKLVEVRPFSATSSSRQVKRAKMEKDEMVLYNCAVSLLSFIPGKTMNEIPGSSDLFFNVGCFAAQVNKVLQDLKCPVLEKRYFNWDLLHFIEAKRVSAAVKDQHHRKLLRKIEKSFRTFVQPKLDILPKQCIHGDMNQLNIIVQNIPGSTIKFEICGLIDFGDLNHTCRVFEISITTAHMMTMALDDPVEAGVYTVAGYQQKNPLTQAESDLIFYLVQARFYQIVCFGTNAVELHPENSEYLLYHVKKAWKVLNKLAAISKDEFDEQWKKLSETVSD